MKFTYRLDGTVTSFGRGVLVGETLGQSTDDQRTLGAVAEYYTAPSGTLTPKTQDEIDLITAIAAKDTAYATQVAAIETKKQSENEKPFPYNGQTYKSDAGAKNDVEGVLGQCALYNGLASIPTFPKTDGMRGKWLTMEDVLVPYTCDEFKVFAKNYFDRFSWNFDNRVTHQLTLAAIYARDDKTAQDVLDYNYSEGWE